MSRRPGELPPAIAEAMREAGAAFGDPRVFLEQAVVRPRHIEVQILADATGETVHLFERDCSVQRRHQKVIEIAPAPNLDDDLRQRIHRDAVAFARSIAYVNAGTVEFLVDTAGERAGQHVFIEMNPRIQVEHTVTEEVTDVDLVQSQMRIAAGATLAELGLQQKDITLHGAALQCRITTEDPSQGFRPDTGRITTYRSPGGAGIRLDGGTTAAGSQISPHFDSMLAKMTCRARDFPAAVARAKRGLAEFRIRGVSTNIPFLRAVLEDPAFAAGDLSTSFIDERPQLLTSHPSRDRATKLLNWLADVTVNRPYGEKPLSVSPGSKLPAIDLTAAPPAGHLERLRTLGPAEFARSLREQSALAVTETTFRDAHQSLLATRVRTRDLVRVGPHVARMTPQLLSVEAWGGATYDVALRFLAEDPWERLEALRAAMPNIPIQMLLRGRNTVGYTPRPVAVTDAFVREAAATGIDIFRIFDALNDVSQMRPGDRRGARHRHRRRRGRRLLHRRPARPERAAVHARLLPAPRREHRGVGRAHHRDQGHGGSSATRRRGEARERRCASGSTSPSTSTRTTPRAASSPRFSRRVRRARMRWMPRPHLSRERRASRRSRRSSPRSRTPTATPASTCRP